MAYESGTSPNRIEWVEEDTEGVTPSDPAWKAFSYNIENFFNWEPDANTTALRGTGDDHPRGFFNGSETHEASFEYSLVRWFVDDTGNAQDPSYYALDTDADNAHRGSHTVVSRQDYSSDGNDSAGRRVYVVGKGGKAGSVTLPFETEEGTPILASLEYQFEKIRAYTIHQPSSSTTIDIENQGTTSVDVTIEDEGASTTDTVTVAGGATATSVETFGDIDAVELSSDVDGDIILTDGSSTEFMRIKGTDSYPADEGDLGVPILGTGSHASAIAEGSEIVFLGDSLTYGTGTFADEIESGELSIELGLDDNPRTGTASRNIHPTEWTAELTASVAGTEVTEQQMVRYLTENQVDITWTTTNGETLDLTDTRMTSPGEFAPETSQGKVMLDATFEAEDITVSNAV